MNKEDCLKAYELMTIGMIEKNPDKLKTAMSKDARLYHMTGRCETREEYIKDILDGTLNYYDYKIENFKFNGEFADFLIKLKAKVYGLSIPWRTLKMNVTFVEEDNLVKVKDCKVNMGR